MTDTPRIHLHLDAVGGVAGDMFCAALLDAHPDLEHDMLHALQAAGLDQLVNVRREDFDDGTLTGSRISVQPVSAPNHDHDHDDSHSHDHSHDHGHGHGHGHDHNHDHGHSHDHDHSHGHGHAHTHRSWRDIRQLLESASLPAGARTAAIEIFKLLAEAEARVHGKSIDDVEFHEVGAWDSIADIVMAGWLIDRLGVSSVSASALPMGRGLVETAHGRLPVPAPATALLLEGMPLIDDGLDGERITPTGAAIVKFLKPRFDGTATARTLKGTGTGFGHKRFPGISNILRVAVYQGASSSRINNESVALVEFEIDDQTPEDLAVGLDNIRQSEHVLDVVQSIVTGKKNRMMIQVQVIARPDMTDSVLQLCFAETTTLGARWQTVNRAFLDRTVESTDVGARTVRIKRAQRPGDQTTTKAEMDDLADTGNHLQRQIARRDAENN